MIFLPTNTHTHYSTPTLTLIQGILIQTKCILALGFYSKLLLIEYGHFDVFLNGLLPNLSGYLSSKAQKNRVKTDFLLNLLLLQSILIRFNLNIFRRPQTISLKVKMLHSPLESFHCCSYPRCFLRFFDWVFGGSALGLCQSGCWQSKQKRLNSIKKGRKV